MKSKPENKSSSKGKASDLLIIALFAFLSLLIQPIVEYFIVWTPIIDNVPLGNHVWTLIMNLICIAAWLGIGFWLTRLAKKECGYDIFQKTSPPSAKRLLIALGIAAVFVAVMYILGGGLSLPYTIGGFTDVLLTVVYYLFQIAHASVLVLVIATAQRAIDTVKPCRFIPFGGIALGVCMAISNLISGFSANGEPLMVLLSAAVVFVCALFYGAVYVAADKKPLYAAPIIIVMYVLI